MGKGTISNGQDKRKEAVEILMLFVERVDKLRNSSYVKRLKDAPLKFTINGKMDEKIILFKNSSINPEHVDAFLFNLRLFIHKRDSISIDKMSSMIGPLRVSEEPKKRFFKQLEYLKRFLCEPSMMKLDEDWPTNDEVLRTVLFGYLGHLKTDQPKYQRYKKWTSNPITVSFIEFLFNNVLITYIMALAVMAGNCQQMLDELLAEDSAK